MNDWMTIKKFCDKCGKSLNFKDLKQLTLNRQSRYTYYLCPVCVIEFKKWINDYEVAFKDDI